MKDLGENRWAYCESLSLKLEEGSKLIDGEYQTCWWATAGGGAEFFSNDESDFHQQVGDWVYVHIRELGSDPINEDADYETAFESVMDTQVRMMVNVLEPRLAELLKEQEEMLEAVRSRLLYRDQETAEWQEEVNPEDIH